jgi:hypothetical protein
VEYRAVRGQRCGVLPPPFFSEVVDDYNEGKLVALQSAVNDWLIALALVPLSFAINPSNLNFKLQHVHNDGVGRRLLGFPRSRRA